MFTGEMLEHEKGEVNLENTDAELVTNFLYIYLLIIIYSYLFSYKLKLTFSNTPKQN